MQELSLQIYDVQELLDKKIEIKEVLDNIALIKRQQQNMAESVAQALLAPIICKYNIESVHLEIEHEGDDFSFCGNIMNYIDGVNGYDNYDEIQSIDGKETITYSELQEDISNALESVYSLLWEDAVIDVVRLRKEFFHASLDNNLGEKKNIKARKI
jgi:hypothetical protein